MKRLALGWKIAFVLLALFVSSCKTYEEAGGIRWDNSFSQTGFFIQTFIVHTSNDTSVLVVKFVNEMEAPEESHARKYLTIKCYGQSGRSERMTDTLIQPFNVSISTGKDTTLLVPFKYLRNQEGNMLVKINSPDSSINSLHYIELNKDDIHYPSFFTIHSMDNKLLNPMFIRTLDTIRISFFDKDVSSANVSYFKISANPAAPTFSKTASSGLPTRSDSVFSYNFNSKICFIKAGLYHFNIQNDSVGLNVLVNNPDFPDLQTVKEIIYPLRYITKNEEYAHLLNSKDQKLSLDSFWIARYKDTKVAKKMIQIYFNRVEHANKYFTNYRPGWMTDEGIIYVLYGKPDRSYKFPDGEIWVYTRHVQQTTEFAFVRKESIYGTYLELKRNPDFYPSWFEQSAKWRRGTLLNE